MWNALIGLIGVVFYEFSVRALFGNAAETGGAALSVSFRFFAIAVLLFGIGYFMVWRDPVRNRAILWLGAVAKLVVFIIVVYYYSSGGTTGVFLLGVSCDLIFAILFFMHLRETKGEPPG